MNQGKGVRLGIDVVWLALLSLYIVAGAALVPFHGDESSKIYVGRDYYYLFLEGDLGKIAHQAKRSSASGEYRANLASGSISNMIYGWLAASSGYAIEDLNDDWHWGQDYAFNLESNRVPDTRLLRSARLASAAQLAAATALLFAFARITVNRPTSFIASLLFAVHPIVLLNGRRAMQEGSHMLGMMLVLAGSSLAHLSAAVVAICALGSLRRSGHRGETYQLFCRGNCISGDSRSVPLRKQTVERNARSAGHALVMRG